MPALVMRSPPGSLLEQTHRLVVRRQMRYAATRGVPWGISESAFNARDLELTYQYSNFGVPGLGLKRGLSEDLVIAPYATALAAMIDPAAAADEPRAARAASARAAPTGSTKRSTTRPSVCWRARPSAWCAPTWRTTRACRSSPSRTCCTDGSMRTRFHARADREGRRAAAPGAAAAGRGRGPAPRRGGRDGGPRARPRARGAAPLQHAPRVGAADASALERRLRGDDHVGGLRLQPLAGSRRHALVGGRDARRARPVRVPARRGHGRRLVGRLSAERRRAGCVRGDLLGGSRRDPPARRSDRDPAGGGGLVRGRRRGAPRLAHESRRAHARDRAHLLRRDRARAPRPRTRPIPSSPSSSCRPRRLRS